VGLLNLFLDMTANAEEFHLMAGEIGEKTKRAPGTTGSRTRASNVNSF
jgi:hypothetical protein